MEKTFNQEREILANAQRWAMIKTVQTCNKKRKERNRKRKAKRRAKY